MIIATLKKQFNDNVELFDVYENNKYKVTTTRNGISYILDINPNRVSNYFIEKGYEDYTFYSIGFCEKMYEFNNRVGSMQEHADWENLTLAGTKKRVERNRDAYVGIRVNGKHTVMQDLDEVLGIKKVKREPVAKRDILKIVKREIKYPYKGENKAYIDYLFDSTFKGWRA